MMGTLAVKSRNLSCLQNDVVMCSFGLILGLELSDGVTCTDLILLLWADP